MSCSYRAFEFLKQSERTRMEKSAPGSQTSAERKWSSARTTSHSSRANYNRMPIMNKNYSEVVKPASSPPSLALNHSQHSSTSTQFETTGKLSSHIYRRRQLSRNRPTSLPLAAYLLKHLYKNKRDWELVDSARWRDGETSLQAGLKGRRQH